MKKLIKSYLSFSRMERMGLIVICTVIVILLATRATMHLWVHPAEDTGDQKKLVAAWEKYKSMQPAAKEVATDTITDTATPTVTTTTTPDATDVATHKAHIQRTKNDYEDAIDNNETPMPDIININSADSATLVRLKGIGPATASKIIARRKAQGPFTSVDQILEVRHIPDATFEILKKHLTVNTSLHR